MTNVKQFLQMWETLISELNEVEVVSDIYESKELLEVDKE